MPARSISGTRMLVGAVQTLLMSGTTLGLDRSELLAEAGISEAELRDRDAYVPFARHVALGEAILRARPKVNVGLATSREASPSTLGILGYVVTHSATMREALDAFIRFQRLVTDGVRFDVSGTNPVRIGLDVDPELARLGQPIEGLLGLWITLGRRLTGTAWTPTSVTFRHAAPSDVREYERFFGVAPVFRAKATTIAIARETMELPIVIGKPALRPSMIRLCEATLAELEGHEGVAARVRETLLEQIPRGMPSKSRVARSLGLGERTLNRKLQAEDTTYRDVLDGVRRELALLWLADANHAVYEVAFLLGYAEPSTFHRSFRRWTGASPHVWRKKHAR